jgi:hypothetical protein
MIIEGGTGNGYAVKVTRDNQLYSYSANVSEMAFLSYIRSDAYNVGSYCSNIATGSYVLFFRNTDPQRNFHIQSVRVGSTIATQWDLFKNSVYAASTGTAITPGNLNYTSGKIAICTCVGTVAVTTITPGPRIARFFSQAYEMPTFPLDGAPIVGLNNDLCVQVTNASSTNELSVIVQGYYKDISANV